MKLSFTIPMRPKAKQSTRFSRRGCYTDKTLKSRELEAKYYLAHQYQGEPITNPVKVTIKATFRIPKKDLKKAPALLGSYYPKTPDFDNACKFCADCLKGVVIADDNLIVDGSIKKVYGLEDKIEIYLEVLDV